MEDVLLCAAAVLADDEQVAAAVRRQYAWFVVDEFQDVSPLQSALLDLWLGGRNDVCVVGDPAQTIDSFAGASADFLVDFPRRHPGTTSVTLHRNYRSTPEIVSCANTVMHPPGADPRSEGAVRLVATRDAGEHVSLAARSDEVAEASNVVADIGGCDTRPAEPREIAVLFRINAQSESLRGGARRARHPLRRPRR